MNNYKKEWKTYKRVRKLLGLSILVLVGSLVSSMILSGDSRDSVEWNFSIFLLFSSGVAFMGCVIYTSFWRCPKCGGKFTVRSSGGLVSNMPVFDDCGNCGFFPEDGDIHGS